MKAWNNLLPPVLTNGSCFVLIFTTMKQPPQLLVNCAKPHFELTGKTSITMSAINAWNKTQTAVSDVTLKFDLQQS